GRIVPGSPRNRASYSRRNAVRSRQARFRGVVVPGSPRNRASYSRRNAVRSRQARFRGVVYRKPPTHRPCEHAPCRWKPGDTAGPSWAPRQLHQVLDDRGPGLRQIGAVVATATESEHTAVTQALGEAAQVAGGAPVNLRREAQMSNGIAL